jgi:hypothetical protein
MGNLDPAFIGMSCLCLALAVTHPEPEKLYQKFGEVMSLQIEQLGDADGKLSGQLLAMEELLRTLLGIKAGKAP